MSGWTYGAELEWPDVDVRTDLDEIDKDWAWSSTDYTIVNSDGIANDPLRKLVLRGGELNTPACKTPSELAERSDVMRALLKPGHNYRSNLHIHVQAPEFGELGNLQRAAAWIREQLPRMLPYTDPLDGLLYDLAQDVEIKAAGERKRHSERSRHFFITGARHAMRMEARTLEEFLAAEVPSRKRDGTPLWHLMPREAVNFRSLRKHGTVEFRCFAGDENAENVYAAACFARDLLQAALNDSKGFALPYFWDLPKQVTFQHDLEMCWDWTNLKHNKREVVRQRLFRAGKLPEQEPACES